MHGPHKPGGENAVDGGSYGLMGFSRGGIIALYAAMKRFQSAWNDSGVTPAAYIPLYPACNFEFTGDNDVVGGPIRIFHGAVDDYVRIGPCKAYVERLKKAGKDAEITALPDAYHAFDNPSLPSEPLFLPDAQTTEWEIVEDKAGALIDASTGKAWASTDPCNKTGAHVGYNAAAAAATDAAVLEFLNAVFKAK